MNFKIMTKQYFIELAEYNRWANAIVCSWLEELTEAQWQQPIVSSFSSIQETVLHLIAAENVWLQRLERQENPVWLQSSYKGSKAEHISLWKEVSKKLKDFIFDMEEQTMRETLEFKRLNGDPYSMFHYQVLAHVFNHSTYHRGQLVTLLRQVGYTAVGSTDLLAFFRN
jgi:uncharacterized damage-inducible protein DinB